MPSPTAAGERQTLGRCDLERRVMCLNLGRSAMRSSGLFSAAGLIAAMLGRGGMQANSQAPVEFDVVSIKQNTGELGAGGGIRTLPDGTFIMANQPMISIIGSASSEPVLLRNVVGAPSWMTSERYDVTAKPPTGATREQISQMWKAMFADRMKLVAHVEQREQTTFALVLARTDGRLGPQLKPSTLDCNPPPAGSPPPQRPASFSDFQNRCGFAGNGTSIISGGITMDDLARSLSGRAGGPVNNRTGLQGFYALTLTFSLSRGARVPHDPTPVDDAPAFFTALQEQLGLKLKAEKGMVPVLVIDHIERPSAN